MTPMEVTVEAANDVAIATVPMDELDAGNVAEFKREMAPVLHAHTKLLLDLGRVRFIDSSGLGAMISCLRQLGAQGGELKLCCLSKPVRAAFELVRMHRIFDLYSSQEEALRAFER